MRRTLGALILGVTAVRLRDAAVQPSALRRHRRPPRSATASAAPSTPGGKDLHQFSVTLSGGSGQRDPDVSGATLDDLTMGVGVGTFADSACTLLTNGSIVTQAGSTAQLSGTLDAGSYWCDGLRRRESGGDGQLRGDGRPLLTRMVLGS